MSVTNYTPDQCRYLLSKLENIVYLVSEDALKDIKIDNGSAYVTSIDESPLSIKCYNLKLTEDETLDERYKFAHTVTFSVNGYMNKDNFNDRYYVILKDKEGTYWLVNPLFPSKVTYIYTLGDMQNHTDFTLATVSNHPVLRLNEFTVSDSNECESYWLDGIEELRLNEKKYSAHIDNHIKYTNPGGFSDIHFNEKSCTITETFDGEKVSHQIDFNILLSQYKNDWHYSLLEFTDNIYAAVFKTLNGKYGLCGFSMGLQPSFTINGESQTTNNYIKISLVDAHTDGLTLDFFDEVDYEYLSSTTWVYTADFGGYECVGEGVARYLLKKEIDALDNETGNYMVLDGYESYFQESSWPVFHIAGTFDTSETFNNIECKSNSCKINTSFPSSIEFNTVDCQTYYINADTNWTITSSKSHITVNPSSGSAGRGYTVNICNTKTPTASAETSTLTIGYCSTSSTVNVIVIEDENACLPQGAVYNIPANATTLTMPTRCCVESVRETVGVGTVSTVYSTYIQTLVPENNSGSNRTITLLVVYCDGTSGNIIINQSNIYEEWRIDGELCINKNKIQREFLWTGSTSSNYVKTDTFNDTLVEADSYDCYGTDEWNYRKYVLVENDYFCDDGNKYGLMRMYVSIDNINWRPTDIYKKGDLIEEHSTDCCWDGKWLNYPYSKYVLVEGEWICNDGNKYQKLLKYFSMDNVTWESSICIFKMGDLIEENSDDCGWITDPNNIFRWVLTNETICVFVDDDERYSYRWYVKDEDEGQCFDGKYYYIEYEQYSTDGENWTDVTPPVSRLGAIKALECPPPEGDKFVATYSDSHTESAQCDNSSAITQNEISLTNLVSVEIGDCVTSIGGSAFASCNSLTSVDIPNSVTSIGRSAFNSCNSLTSIDIPNSVTSIGQYAFIYCSGLISATIGNSVTSIGDSAFSSCSSLTSCTIGSGVTSIGGYAFSNCSSLTSIVIPNSVTTIGGNVFYYCTSLTSCTIGSGVTSIGDSVFYRCIALTSIDIPDSVTTIGGNAFRVCSGLTNIDIPNSVTSIGSNAFQNCSGLTSCTIGNGITDIGNSAFTNCTSLQSITVNATTPPILRSDAFKNTNNCPIYVPTSSVNTYKNKTGWSTYASRISEIT